MSDPGKASGPLTEEDLLELALLKEMAAWNEALEEGDFRSTAESGTWYFTAPALAKAARSRDAEALRRALDEHLDAIRAWEDAHLEDRRDILMRHKQRYRIVHEGLPALSVNDQGALTGLLHGRQPRLHVDHLADAGLVIPVGDIVGWQLTRRGEQLAREADAQFFWVYTKKDCGCEFARIRPSDTHFGDVSTEDGARQAIGRISGGLSSGRPDLDVAGMLFDEIAQRYLYQPSCHHSPGWRARASRAADDAERNMAELAGDLARAGRPAQAWELFRTDDSTLTAVYYVTFADGDRVLVDIPREDGYPGRKDGQLYLKVNARLMWWQEAVQAIASMTGR